MPPLGQVIDAAVVAPKCDGTMLVLDTGSVRYRQAQEVVAQLNKSGGKILGVVRNKVSKGNGKYYSGKYYGKKKYYGYGRNEAE
jgi:Mrp family chromosome partitioning ATPase